MNRTRSAVVVVTLAVLLGSAGCSEDDPQPKIAPSSQSPSPTAVSSEPTPSPSVEPLDPVETVEAWVEAQNIALNSGDTRAMQALSATSCRACEDFIHPIEDVYARGGQYETQGWALVKARARPASADPIVIDAAVTIAGGRTVVEEGAEPVVYGPENRILVFKLVPDREHWEISFIGFL